MTREEVFEALRARGADTAVLRFSGAHDGSVDSLELFAGDAPLEAPEKTHPVPRRDPDTGDYLFGADGVPEREPLTKGQEEDNSLAEALQSPIWDRYGDFANDPGSEGTLTWDCAEKKVSIEAQETTVEDVYVEL